MPVVARRTMLVLVMLLGSSAAAQDTPTGPWRGTLEREGRTWMTEIVIDEADEGFQAWYSFSDFGVLRMPADRVVVDGASVRFEIPVPKGTIDAVISGDSLTGQWTRSDATRAEVVLTRAPDAPPLAREVPIGFSSTGGARLEGTLLLPPGDGRFAAIVLTHGSGPDTRSTFPYMGRAQLAVANGVAAFVYDKRGAGASTGEGSWRLPNLIADAEAAVKAVRQHPRIDPSRVGIGGSSQGGWVAPAAAARDPEIAFLFAGAVPAMSGAEQNVHSMRTRLERDEALDRSDVRRAVAALRAIYEWYRTGEGRDEVLRRLEAPGAERWREHPMFTRLLFTSDGELPKSVDPTDWSTMFIDPMGWWREIRVPVLCVWGANDINLPPVYSQRCVAAALDFAGNRDHQLIVFDQAGHGLEYEDPDLDGWDWPRMAPGYLEKLARWYRQQAERPALVDRLDSSNESAW